MQVPVLVLVLVMVMHSCGNELLVLSCALLLHLDMVLLRVDNSRHFMGVCDQCDAISGGNTREFVFDLLWYDHIDVGG